MCDRVFKLALLGVTDEEMADVLGIALSTLYAWKKTHAEFSEAITRGKLDADSEIAHSMYQRAKGYSHRAVKIAVNADGDITKVPYVEHYPPDTAAATMWLTNRRHGAWKRHITHDGEVGVPVQYVVIRTERSKPQPEETT
jgi:hypothetical protein